MTLWKGKFYAIRNSCQTDNVSNDEDATGGRLKDTIGIFKSKFKRVMLKNRQLFTQKTFLKLKTSHLDYLWVVLSKQTCIKEIIIIEP